MLKLRKVELVGFKSFCEKTQITFSGAGLTCIIGPNGCGKSNIVDAISWVLGEQSHKSLRAERMSDCIFNGTAKRPPLGLAEVTLTLVDPELAEAAEFVLGPQHGENGAHGPVGVPDSAFGATANAKAFNTEGTEDTENSEREAEISGDGATETAQDAAADAEIDGSRAPAFVKKKRAGGEKHSLQLKPGEVVVGRRLYRSGQSEYLINGRVARLRDIQDLFMGIGLGPDSYAIIEQGRIGQILSSKPTDRRAIIEEAAGITKFKTKRRLSEAKLESSKVNLSRVNDIYVEVEKQLASLKRQASKARRYAEIREQMRGLLRQVLASKAKELDMEADRLGGLLGGISQQESTEAQSVSQWETEQDRLSSRTYELEGELRQHQNVLGQTALELDRSENRILFNKQRTAELTGRLQQLTAELEQSAAQAAQVETRATAHGESVATIKTEVARVEAILATLTAATAEISGAHNSAEAHIAALRRTAAQLGEQLTRLHGEQAQAEQTLAHQLEGVERFGKQELELLDESLHHRDRSQAADLHWEDVQERTRSLEELVKNAQAGIANLRTQRQEATKQVGATRDALAGGRARRASVEQILNERSYTADAVQKLFASSQVNEAADGFRAVGVLADYAEVGQEYESAIEQFLRDELEYVVVENFDVARAGIAMLRDEVGGRATFFVDSIRKLNLQPNEPVVSFNFENETVSRLDRLVEFRDPLGPAAKQFLPRLKSAFLVEQAEVAERLARENPAYSFVTPDGTTYQGRVVSGGRPSETGPLGMKRELRALDAEVLQFERAAAEAQATLQRIEEDLRTSEVTLEQATAQHVESQKLLVAANLQRDQARGDMVRLEIELRDCQTELARLRNGAAAAQQRAEAAQAKRGEISGARTQAELDIAQAMEQQIALRQTAQARQEELSTRRAEMAGLAERLASAETIAARIAHELQELVARRQALVLQHDSLVAEQGQLATQTGEHQKQVASLRAEKLRLEARGTELEKEFEDTRIRATHMDDTLRHARQKLGDFREQRSKLEIERARNDSEREHLRQSCAEELNAQPEDLIAEFPALLSGEELRTSDAQYHELKSRIESMGPINMMALEEYNECEQRFEFLGRERTDLLQSITDTQQAIAELDEVCKLKFEEAFNFINTNFATAFHTLLGGGTGEMRLSEPDSSGEPGIDVVAQPPGKRLQNVLLLSGGEKAMTALALLIAIFRYQPSPFCILDEVDAPLDEANVGRFTKLVSEMSAGTQFIVVTHNRRTMEMASVLYGVTMQEPGVSKLVSVRWDEAGAAKAATNAA
ncbi:MAG TPA: chromosome segregation protein SMC [Candidatus Acidoferrales bacterium]|nr:chromosome segregation protein SMC [Candidatus Acidoferrales bacterium]